MFRIFTLLALAAPAFATPSAQERADDRVFLRGGVAPGPSAEATSIPASAPGCGSKRGPA